MAFEARVTRFPLRLRIHGQERIMNRNWMVVAAALALVLLADDARSQAWTGSLTTGVEYACCALIRGSALASVGKSSLSIGAQGDLMVWLPYATGRGGPLAELRLRSTGRPRPFVSAGYIFEGTGEPNHPIFGAGLDIWMGQRRGLRIAAQDWIRHEPRFCFRPTDCIPARNDQRPSVQVGIVWR